MILLDISVFFIYSCTVTGTEEIFFIYAIRNDPFNADRIIRIFLSLDHNYA